MRKEGHCVFDERKFRAQIVLKGLTVKDLATQLGVNESTLHRKIRQDGNFSRDEINKLISILDIENPADIFFADELA